MLGGADPAAAAGLRAYAEKAKNLGYDQAYVDDVLCLAEEFEFECLRYREEGVLGDPTAPPHRQDNPIVVALLKQAGKEK